MEQKLHQGTKIREQKLHQGTKSKHQGTKIIYGTNFLK
jgi:hypothetical protein